jgi:hypothetical protein
MKNDNLSFVNLAQNLFHKYTSHQTINITLIMMFCLPQTTQEKCEGKGAKRGKEKKHFLNRRKIKLLDKPQKSISFHFFYY